MGLAFSPVIHLYCGPMMLETGQTFEFDSSVSFSFSFSYTLVHGERVPLHQHSQGQVVYPATGIMAVTTESGTW